MSHPNKSTAERLSPRALEALLLLDRAERAGRPLTHRGLAMALGVKEGTKWHVRTLRRVGFIAPAMALRVTDAGREYLGARA